MFLGFHLLNHFFFHGSQTHACDNFTEIEAHLQQYASLQRCMLSRVLITLKYLQFSGDCPCKEGDLVSLWIEMEWNKIIEMFHKAVP